MTCFPEFCELLQQMIKPEEGLWEPRFAASWSEAQGTPGVGCLEREPFSETEPSTWGTDATS